MLQEASLGCEPCDVIMALFKTVSMETDKMFRMGCIQSRWLIQKTMAAVLLARMMEDCLLKQSNRTHAKKMCAEGVMKHPIQGHHSTLVTVRLAMVPCRHNSHIILDLY